MLIFETLWRKTGNPRALSPSVDPVSQSEETGGFAHSSDIKPRKVKIGHNALHALNFECIRSYHKKLIREWHVIRKVVSEECDYQECKFVSTL